MIKSPDQKIGKCLLLVVFCVAVMACNLPNIKRLVEEAYYEYCVPVSRVEYENAAAELGKSPAIARYPDTAEYYVCYVNDRSKVIASTRMTDGTAPVEAGDNAAPDEAERNAIPSGSYKGKITDTEMATRGLIEWQVQGSVENNEVSINVSDDGAVTGRFLYEKLGNIVVSDDGGGSHAPCVDSNDQYFSGTASGKLTGSSGEIVFTIQQTIISKLTEGCSIGPKEKSIVKDHVQHFDIRINGSEMTGTSVLSEEDGHPIKATFKLVRR